MVGPNDDDTDIRELDEFKLFETDVLSLAEDQLQGSRIRLIIESKRIASGTTIDGTGRGTDASDFPSLEIPDGTIVCSYIFHHDSSGDDSQSLDFDIDFRREILGVTIPGAGDQNASAFDVADVCRNYTSRTASVRP